MGVSVARNYEEALNLLKKGELVNILSLDHDLGEDETGQLLLSGYDLVKTICAEGFTHIQSIYIHTDNPVGRENMYQTLLSAIKRGFLPETLEVYNYPYVPNRA